MKKQLFIEQNLGVGDHFFIRIFLDSIKNNYERIYIAHSKDALAFWFANDQKRLEFNTKLATLVFNEPPYVFVPNPRMRFPFFPYERIIKELNNKPIKPNCNNLCVGNSIDVPSYIVMTTKVREFPKILFDEMKEKLTPALQKLSNTHKVVILGEREVQKTREYEAECNKQRVFGIYEYLTSILNSDNVIDLTIPALGITAPDITQFQQDCLILKEAKAVITFGTGGNFWMSTSVATKTIGLRADEELERVGISIDYDSTFLTKDIELFTNYLASLCQHE